MGRQLLGRKKRATTSRKNGFGIWITGVLAMTLLISLFIGSGSLLADERILPVKTGESFTDAPGRQGATTDDMEDGDAEDDVNIEELLNETGAVGETSKEESLAASSSPFQWEGQLLSSIWIPAYGDASVHTTNRLDLEARDRLGGISVRGRLKADYQDLDESDKARLDLRELFGEYRFGVGDGGIMDFSVGKRILYWGKGDEVRPMDRINAQDRTSFLFYDLNDRKTGRIGAFLNIDSGGNIRMEGFWSPYFEADEMPGPDAYFEAPALRNLRNNGIGMDDDIAPDDWTMDAGIGGRLMFSVFNADVALYALQGYDPSPTYTVGRTGLHPLYGIPVVPLSIAAAHPRITLFGFDMERSIGPIVLRVEAAYQPDGALFAVGWQENPILLLDYPRGVVEKRQFQYVVGLDKNDLFIHNLFFNLQGFGGIIFDYDPDLSDPESQTGVSALLRYTFLDSRAELKYRFTAVFPETSRRHNAEINGKPAPYVQIGIGGIWYEGHSAGTFGMFDDKDFVYGKMKLIF